ncbi:MAG TPA: hypothetical protein DCQ30_10275 [Acidimicrobiaceae bacterium]|nr:hypothetical protein [Acidimicrobiaceae bacterium]
MVPSGGTRPPGTDGQGPDSGCRLRRGTGAGACPPRRLGEPPRKRRTKANRGHPCPSVVVFCSSPGRCSGSGSPSSRARPQDGGCGNWPPQLARTARYQGGRIEGFRYRLAGRHPDPAVTDGVLADRIRSTLGPLEHRLDIPRIHVLACGHDVMLHGDVDDARHARELVAAVAAVPGVAHVDSHLRVGLIPGDSRPSEGGARH